MGNGSVSANHITNIIVFHSPTVDAIDEGMKYLHDIDEQKTPS